MGINPQSLAKYFVIFGNWFDMALIFFPLPCSTFSTNARTCEHAKLAPHLPAGGPASQQFKILPTAPSQLGPSSSPRASFHSNSSSKKGWSRRLPQSHTTQEVFPFHASGKSSCSEPTNPGGGGTCMVFTFVK